MWEVSGWEGALRLIELQNTKCPFQLSRLSTDKNGPDGSRACVGTKAGGDWKLGLELGKVGMGSRELQPFLHRTTFPIRCAEFPFPHFPAFLFSACRSPTFPLPHFLFRIPPPSCPAFPRSYFCVLLLSRFPVFPFPQFPPAGFRK